MKPIIDMKSPTDFLFLVTKPKTKQLRLGKHIANAENSNQIQN